MTTLRDEAETHANAEAPLAVGPASGNRECDG